MVNRRKVLKATAVGGSGLAALAYSPRPTLAASNWTANSPSQVSNENGELSSLEIPASGFSFSLDYNGLGLGSHSINFELEAKLGDDSSFETVFSDTFEVNGDEGTVDESKLSTSFPVDLLAETSLSASDFNEPNAGETETTTVDLRASFDWSDSEYSASESAVSSFNVNVEHVAIAPTDGLIAHYPFDVDASDATGNGHDGTVNGATHDDDAGPQEDGAYSFGGDDWIDITGVGVPSQITYGGWIKFNKLPSETSRAQTLVALNDDGGPANSGSWVGSKTNDEFGLELGSGSNYYATSTGETIQKDTWYHLMVAYSSSGEVRAYFNGSRVLTDSYGDGLVEGSRIQQAIGANSSTSRLHDGLIDDVRIYDRALSDSEVQSVFDATKP